MEIITYVLEGGLLHRDSMGQRHVLRRNEVQTMSAGSGIVHSEFNASETEPVHSIQIWITPDAEDFEPSYQQIAFSAEERQGKLRLLASPSKHAANGSTVIHQDAYLYATELGAEDHVRHTLDSGRHAWIQVVRGSVVLNGTKLEEGDGAAVTGEREVAMTGPGELLLFDLA
jgi:redox-sensitive bicupin YhaK (pirin superfamily)